MTQVADMTRETTTTQGTGTISLGGAVAGWEKFRDQFSDGAEVFYAQRQLGGDWETCKGTLVYGVPDTLTRDQVIDSSNGGAAVNWGEGTREVYCTVPASQLLLAESSGGFALKSNNLSDLVSASAARTNLGLGTIATVASPVPVANGGTGSTTAANARTALGLGTAAVANTGTAAGNVPVLDGSARLPAVDGSQLTNLPSSSPIPSGTKMIFFQAAAPTGWTQDVTQNDKVLRVVSGAGAGTGGSWTISGCSVDDHTLIAAEMPNHSHLYDIDTSGGSGGAVSGLAINNVGTLAATQSLSTSDTGGGDPHGHGFDSDGTWRPAYINVIVCTKN